MLTTKNFTYDAKSQELSAEASDLPEDLGKTVTVKSHVTGKEVIFKLNYVQRDADHDIVFWEYRSDSPKLTMKVYND